MGADVQIYKVKCTINELGVRTDELRADEAYEHGHGGYTGTIAEDNGLVSIVDGMMSESEAEDYIYKNAEKWMNSIAIQVSKDVWIIGGCYSC